MCVNQREITNKYTGQKLYVKCGHCPACLQEKAAYRVSRIKAQDSPEFDTVMVGLTYSRHCAPYVKREEAYLFAQGRLLSPRGKHLPLPIYRDITFRKVRQNAAYDINYKCIEQTQKLASIDYVGNCDFTGNHDLRGDTGKIGVAYYPDLQHFLARLRLNLKRNYNFNHEFKCFCCSEYGAGRIKGKGVFRPHFHVLFWIPKGTYQSFRSAVVASWPYGDLSRFPRAVEKAFRASSYVASYVNCGSDFPNFLRKYFSPKHSYSKGFGMSNELFSLDKILEKFSCGHLTLFMQDCNKVGSPISELPFPKYVIHRYFPQFKGYNRVVPTSLCDIMGRITAPFLSGWRNPRYLSNEYYEYEEKPMSIDLPFAPSDGDSCAIWDSNIKFFVPSPVTDYQFINMMSFPVYYDVGELYRIGVRLRNAYKRFCDNCDLNLSFYEYAKLHKKIWSLYASDVLRLHLQNEEIPLNEKYDNLEDIKCRHVHLGTPLPVGFTFKMLDVTDPNKFKTTLFHDGRFRQSFFEHLKHRRVSNTVLSSMYEEF